MRSSHLRLSAVFGSVRCADCQRGQRPAKRLRARSRQNPAPPHAVLFFQRRCGCRGSGSVRSCFFSFPVSACMRGRCSSWKIKKGIGDPVPGTGPPLWFMAVRSSGSLDAVLASLFACLHRSVCGFPRCLGPRGGRSRRRRAARSHPWLCVVPVSHASLRGVPPCGGLDCAFFLGWPILCLRVSDVRMVARVCRSGAWAVRQYKGRAVTS